MNLQQFLSQQPVQKLIHQYFSIQGQSQKSKSQESTLINSILLAIASSASYTFQNLYQQCQYQIQVSNQARDSVNKLCRLLTTILTKATYLLKKVELKFLTEEVFEFLLSKVFITMCSDDCVKCIWAIVSAYVSQHPLVIQENSNKRSDQKCCGSKTNCCQSSQTMMDENEQKSCCKGSCSKKSTGCCKSNQSSKQIPSQVKNHEIICKLIITRLLNTFKLHVKSYQFKVRKDIFKLINYVLKFVEFSQSALLLLIPKVNFLSKDEAVPLLTQIGITKQNLIELIIKNLSDQKDPRNMQLIFQNYLLLIKLFSKDIQQLNYKSQIFQNIEVYYPLSMEGDQEFKIDPEDQFNQKDLRQLLDQCFLQQIFKNEVRQMLIDKMSAPPIHQFAQLYVKFINRFNPYLKKSNFASPQIIQEERGKFSILTMNLLNRLCQQEYLDENYGEHQHEGHCNDSGCNSKKQGSKKQFSISQLISSIIRNVFISPVQSCQYIVYPSTIQSKFVEFLNNLIVLKLFSHQQNNKHAGTIIDIVQVHLFDKKTILNSQSHMPASKSINKVEQKGCCNGDTKCGEKNHKSRAECQPVQCHNESAGIVQVYGQKISYQQMLVDFVILKFMQYWSAKGDVAFKLGLLIIALNKKLQSTSIESFVSSNKSKQQQESHLQSSLQHLLLSLGNIYETYKIEDQIKIMVLKSLMIIASIFKKLSSSPQTQEKNLNKIRKLNNCLIHKDCMKVASLLSEKQQKEENSFSKSQQPILKSYVDYIMEVYLGYQLESQTMKQDLTLVVENIIVFEVKGLKDFSQFLTKLEKNEGYFDVKLYAAVRYLAIQNSKSKCLKIERFVSKVALFLLLTNAQKLINLLKYYTYQSTLHIVSNVLQQIKILDSENISNQDIQSFALNLSKLGKLLCQKFQEHYHVELQCSTDSTINLIQSDIRNKSEQRKMQQIEESNALQIFLLYVFKSLWKTCSLGTNIFNDKDFLRKLKQQSYQMTPLNQSDISQSQKLAAEIINRMLTLHNFLLLYSKDHFFQQIVFSSSSVFSQLQTTLLYVKFLKKDKREDQIQFDSKLVELYDPGMIEYFWMRLLDKITYEQNLVSQQIKKEILDIVSYLPSNLLEHYAQKIAPILIYSAKSDKKMIQEEKQSQIDRKLDKFDYSRSQLIGKISQNLPQTSLIQYVVPYCLYFLRQSAISCQNDKNIGSQFIQPENSIQVCLNINRVLHVLVGKSQQRLSNKVYKNQKLKKCLFETHKKQLNQYLTRLIYHKKRIIRQSSRNLLMSFQ